ARDMAEPHQAAGAPERKRTHRRQSLSSVEQREPFLRRELYRRDTGASQRLATRNPLAAIDRFALANHAKRDMRQRREITARSHRSLLWDPGMHAGVEHRCERLRDHWTDAAVSERQRVRPQRDDCARLGFRQRAPNAAGVAANQIELQPLDLVLGDAHLAQLAEAG